MSAPGCCPPAGNVCEAAASAAPCPTCTAAGAQCAQCEDAALEAALSLASASASGGTPMKACPVCRCFFYKARGHGGNHDVLCPQCGILFCYCCLAYGAERSGPSGEGPNPQPHACSSWCSELCDCPPCPICRQVTEEEEASGVSGRCEHADSPHSPPETLAQAALRLARHPAAVAAHKSKNPWWAGPCRFRRRLPVAAAQGAGAAAAAAEGEVP
jgi:hypothetical protein